MGSELVPIRQASAAFIAAALQHVGHEIRAMNAVVRSLEKPARQRIQNSYPETDWWRGLADPSFIQMADMLALIATADRLDRQGEPCFVLTEAKESAGPSPIVRLTENVV